MMRLRRKKSLTSIIKGENKKERARRGQNTQYEGRKGDFISDASHTKKMAEEHYINFITVNLNVSMKWTNF